ncbi:heavy metal translocating P-type ATPase [Pseudonocardia halophobica]|uniref:Copper-translocating P-type ATPase n=1 Tax=Pseudonocardia halophobica TaxID=29401 RepID=A0A9W6L731_9PSEU|nr:copper-translocating P-type ATPase [Pseudonocardia halophobica]GLL14298.1 copper-translocating P-type ATPase [Pseudonocardia halophobica]
MDHREHGVATPGETSHDGHAGHVTHGEHGGQEVHAGREGHAGHGAGHGGHGAHGGHGDHAAQFRDRFWWNLALAVPVVAFSPMFADLLGYELPGWTWWISPLLGTVVFLWGGAPFLTGAWSEIKARQPGMMLLIGLAITVAFVASALTTARLLMLDFWWELALLVVIMLLGHWLEMRALGQASGALDALAALLPDSAERVTDAGVEEVPLDALVAGDTVLVRSGGRVPADGVVVDGEAAVDESMITGESRTVTRQVGDRVVAGTVATDSAVRVRVDKVGEDTALAGIRRLVEQAQTSRSRAQALADRAAALLFWFASGVAVVTFVVWVLLGDVSAAVERTVTVLVISCPHALGLAIPLVIAISTARAARTGILVKDRLALERMRKVDAVLFDKTGTLTTGRPAVVGTVGAAETLPLAAAVEADSEHPLAKAVVAAARETVPAASRATGFRSLTGRGVRAEVDGAEIAVGGPGLLRESGAPVPREVSAQAAEWAAAGSTVLYVLRDDAVVGALALADAVRLESKAAVRALHDRGVRAVMITGDARPVAEAVGAEVGVDEVFAEVLPEDKDAAVARLQERGHTVAMVGDGVNDAPALARADVGIAIGAGTDVAIESAGVVLASDDPRAVLSVIELSRAGYRKMLQNLAWATGYNLISVPLAAGVLAGVGFVLPPAVGAILMSLSTIVVAANAQLLRRVDLRPDHLA